MTGLCARAEGVPAAGRRRVGGRADGRTATGRNLGLALLLARVALVRAQAPAPSLANATYWVLAPLPLGSAEAGDVLARGGFDGTWATFNASALVFSEMAAGGVIGWQTSQADPFGLVNVNVSYDQLNFMASALGNEAQNFQGWAGTNFSVAAAGTYLIQCGAVNEFLVDGQRLRGDPYAEEWWFGENYWLRLPVTLSAGVHSLWVRVLGDFRCNFVDPPAGQNLSASPLVVLDAENPSYVNPGVAEKTPAIVEGALSSPLLAFPVLNTHPTLSATALRASVVSAVYLNVNGTSLGSAPITGNTSVPLSAAPGQIVPLSLTLQLPSPLPPTACTTPVAGPTPANWTLPVAINVSVVVQAVVDGATTATTHTTTLACSRFGPAAGFSPTPNATQSQPYRFTFLDVDGSVQYASALPPVAPCATSPNPRVAQYGCPVVFATHGASVDAAYGGWTGAYPSFERAWVLFPTNRGAFGFDWQGPGRVNGLRALAALAHSLPGVPTALRSSFAVDPERILFTGHSMGGHGCLLLSGTHPDRALGAGCAAAWIKLWQYVPFTMNLGASFTDPRLRGLLESASTDHDSDLYVPHLVNVPFTGRMGGSDDVVCPWNLRRFARLLHDASVSANASALVRIEEVPGQPHWWGGAVDFGSFLPDTIAASEASGNWPALPARGFRLVAVNLWTEGKGGLRVLQMQRPGQLAVVDVTYGSDGVAAHARASSTGPVWTLTTRNARRLAVGVPPYDDGQGRSGRVLPTGGLVIDGTALPWVNFTQGHYCRPTPSGAWTTCAARPAASTTWAQGERSPAAAGPLRHVFFSAPVAIVVGTRGSAVTTATLRAFAVSWANDLVAQGRFRVQVLDDTDVLAGLVQPVATGSNPAAAPNLVLLGGPSLNAVAGALNSPNASVSSFATSVSFDANGDAFSIGGTAVSQGGLGLLFFGTYDVPSILPNAAAFSDDVEAGTDPTGLFPEPAASALGLSVPRQRLFLVAHGIAAGAPAAAIQGLRATSLWWPYYQSTAMEAANLPSADFLVLGAETAWEGAGGVRMAGFFDPTFAFDPLNSYVGL